MLHLRTKEEIGKGVWSTLLCPEQVGYEILAIPAISVPSERALELILSM